MTLLLGALAMGRAQANARMTETFEFYTTALVFNETTLDDDPTDTIVLTTAGRLKVTQAQGRDVESASQFPVVQRLEVHIPSGSVVVPVGTLVRVTASTADVSIVGRKFRVSERPQAGQTTAHRYAVEEF